MMLLLDKTRPGEERLWYLNATIENGWSRAVLDHQIDLRLYERQRLAGKVTNFSRTLPAPERSPGPPCTALQSKTPQRAWRSYEADE